MKQLPAIGARVSYRHRTRGELRECTGTVTAHYHGERRKDPDTGKFYFTPVHAAVLVDAPLPSWWRYGKGDTFAPPIDELSPLV